MQPKKYSPNNQDGKNIATKKSKKKKKNRGDKKSPSLKQQSGEGSQIKILYEHAQSHKVHKLKKTTVAGSSGAAGCITIQPIPTATSTILSTHPRQLTPASGERRVTIVAKPARHHSNSKTAKDASQGSVTTSAATPTLPQICTTGPAFHNQNATLRWDNVLENSDEENGRIDMYKTDRRKRYLTARNVTYADWMKSYHAQLKQFAEDTINKDSVDLQTTTATARSVGDCSGNSRQPCLPDVVTSSMYTSALSS